MDHLILNPCPCRLQMQEELSESELILDGGGSFEMNVGLINRFS